jgi:CheY-like chemotaxis protein
MHGGPDRQHFNRDLLWQHCCFIFDPTDRTSMEPTQQRIFIVEDNPVFQTLILKQLEEANTELHVYGNGEEFLAQAMVGPNDLVVLDYQLEGSINGFDVLRELKKMPIPPAVIFFSSNLEISITSSILKLGVVEYIEKTIFALSRLKDTIQHVRGNADLKAV